jgi:hypothetical protein
VDASRDAALSVSELAGSAKGTLQLALRCSATPFGDRITMGRGILLWLLGIPIPILLLMWLFGWLS